MDSLSNISTRAFTEKEAAKYIGMSRSFLAQARMTGARRNRTCAPPFIQIGRSIRYLRDDLDTWLTSIRKMSHNDS